MADQSPNLNSISLLIESTRNGESESRDRLFAQLQGYLELTANRNTDAQTMQKAGASDIVQASFVTLVEKFDQFQGKTSQEFKAWIKTIVTNEANRVRRTYNTRMRDSKREVSISSTPGLSPADNNLTPSSDALRAEQKKKFHEILGFLSDQDSEVIRLRNIESLSFREIGEKMNRSEQAASQLWYRAILKFEERLRASECFDE